MLVWATNLWFCIHIRNAHGMSKYFNCKQSHKDRETHIFFCSMMFFFKFNSLIKQLTHIPWNDTKKTVELMPIVIFCQNRIIFQYSFPRNAFSYHTHLHLYDLRANILLHLFMSFLAFKRRKYTFFVKFILHFFWHVINSFWLRPSKVRHAAAACRSFNFVYFLYLLLGTWGLGWILCDIWISLDVLLCTASILSLCAISIDRWVNYNTTFKNCPWVNF